ncbi:DEAD/DEAH box helicase [Dyadobacter fanqingshengii]|uniref:DEAD/DEAH box helicase n=1 Tax=Dyadobacter fanqingshengii TaxID=2906443 RepID=A0A9X1P7S0_9BACT|nr:DEAD/DEAH box helicase [Dyadobacter fanqingshengii]MCF0039179.1 DEAD/DEAH box helicase [Dyadobacter fanqingshengii]USJ34002.1 DEAD/DEAH box helicase [Dyadobacter fanqingshengii]
MTNPENTTINLAGLGITELNEMQQQANEAIQQNSEVVLLAPTGSGKTLAFLLPVASFLKLETDHVQCMVIVPTRELALQIEQVWKKMSTGFKVTCCYGGHDMRTEIRSLVEAPALIVGTPGRILDHIRRNSFTGRHISTLILDEFDKSLELGFQEEMSEIVRNLRNVKKKVLVSATTTKIPSFTSIKAPVTVDFVTNKNKSAGLTVVQVLAEKDKMTTLVKLLSFLGAESTLIFCNQRDSVERISAVVKEEGIDCAYFHGKLEQEDRERTLIRFRNGSVLFLAATDLAARGLDIPDMKHVIHFELPMKGDEFTHRNGRTARMLAEGTAYILMDKEDKLPEYISSKPKVLDLPAKFAAPPVSDWVTIYISGGKKSKLNKMDIVGFLLQKGKLEKQDLGLIEVKDNISFAAVKRGKAKAMLQLIAPEKMKGKKYKIEVAR